MLRIQVAETARGLAFRQGRKSCPLAWPEGAWKKLPAPWREVLADNLAHLLTVDLPLRTKTEGIQLNRPRPCFWAQFRTVVLGGIPQAVDAGRSSTSAALERFRSVRYAFSDDVPRIPPGRKWETKPRAVVAFSPDAPGLASLGLAREMGLDPVPLVVDDTDSPTESRALRASVEKLRAMGFPAQVVASAVGRLGGTCGATGLALIALPLAHEFRARHIVLANDQDMNVPFANKDGFLTYPSFDRTSSWTMQIDMMTRTLTGGSVGTMSLVEPLTGAGAAKVLAERYPGLAELCVRAKSRRRKESPPRPLPLAPCGTVPPALREKLMRILHNAVGAG